MHTNPFWAKLRQRARNYTSGGDCVFAELCAGTISWVWVRREAPVAWTDESHNNWQNYNAVYEASCDVNWALLIVRTRHTSVSFVVDGASRTHRYPEGPICVEQETVTRAILPSKLSLPICGNDGALQPVLRTGHLGCATTKNVLHKRFASPWLLPSALSDGSAHRSIPVQTGAPK